MAIFNALQHVIEQTDKNKKESGLYLLWFVKGLWYGGALHLLDTLV